VGRFGLHVGRFGYSKRPNSGRFGLITWAVLDSHVGRFGFGPFWSFPLSNLNYCTVYTVSKNIPDIIDCNMNKDYQTSIIFGTNIPHTTGHQLTIQVATSPNACLRHSVVLTDVT